MEEHVKSSLLWGVVGTLSFLVLLQAYHLIAGEFVEVTVTVAAGGVVFVATAVSTHLLRPRLAARNERP